MHINFGEISKQFYQWAMQYIKISKNEWISNDGKAIFFGTVTKVHSIEQGFVSLVSLYCSKQKMILGNAQVYHSKESAIPVEKQLIEALDLEGVTFELNALHFQKNERSNYLQ